jgi:hypothetical protein
MLKNMTIALIIALIYEIVLKLVHMAIPNLFTMPFVYGIVPLLFNIVGVIVILFMFSFYLEERSDKKVESVLRILIGCMVLHFIFRLPGTQKMIGFQVFRLIGEAIGLVQAILLFALVIVYKKTIPYGEDRMTQAAVFVIDMFGIGIAQSLYSFIYYIRYAISGKMTDTSFTVFIVMLILFALTHAAMINFLYRYYQFKFIPKH